MSSTLTELGARQGAYQRLAEPGSWRALAAAADVPSFVAAWLALISAQIDVSMFAAAGSDGRVVTTGFVALRQDGAQRFGRAGRYGETDPGVLLTRAAERCLQMRRPVAQRSDEAGSACQLVVPILIADRLDGAVALELSGAAGPHLDAALRIVQWGIGWFDRLLGGRSEEGAADTALAAIDLVTKDGSGAACAQAACTLLAHRFDVARVSLGAGTGAVLTPVGTSGGGLAATPTDFVVALRAAMEEAAQHAQPIAYPGGQDQLAATGAHQRLCRSHGSAWAVSLPVACAPHGVAVLTMEGEGQPPPPATIARWETVARAVAPAFMLRRRAELGVASHLLAAGRAEIGQWRGGGRRERLIGAVAVAFALLFLAFGRGDYRVSARATLEGVVKRAMVAPFDSYLAEALARPGDRVKAGTVLARLDDRDLRLQRADHDARRAEAQRQADEAIGKRDIAGAGIALAHREQAVAELALIDENLTRTQLTAPFDSIVISGDPAQNIGAPVRRGDIIYEVSPLDAFRVAIEVDQADFADVEPGQQGELLLTPLPNVAWPLRVATVTPIATARDGRTAFRVDASLGAIDPVLRPGMQGIAKINVGRRRFVWIWTHDAVNWARLKLWEYLP